MSLLLQRERRERERERETGREEGRGEEVQGTDGINSTLLHSQHLSEREEESLSERERREGVMNNHQWNGRREEGVINHYHL